MREGEVLGLVWNRVLSLEDRVIRLDASETKDNQERIIPMSGEVFFCLQDRYREVVGNPVPDIAMGLRRIFTVSKDQFIYDVRGACKGASIPYGRTLKNGFTPHSLRHTFNTEMALTGIPQFVIQELTGHSSDEMFKRYLHIMTATKKKAIEQLEEYVQGTLHNGQEVTKPPTPDPADSCQSVNQSVNQTPFQAP